MSTFEDPFQGLPAPSDFEFADNDINRRHLADKREWREGCGETFRTDHPHQRYCNRACKRRAQNARHYAAHRAKIIARNRRNQKHGKRTIPADVVE